MARPAPGAIATPGATAAQQPPDYTGPIDNTTTHKPTADGGYDVYDALGRFTYHQPPDQLNTVGKVGQGVLRTESSIPIVGPYLVQGGAGLANAIVPGSAAKAGVNSDGSVTPGYGTGNYGTPGAGGGSLDLSALQRANAVSAGMSAQENTAALNYQPYASPVAQAAQAQAAMAGYTSPIQAGTATAQYATAAQIQQTALAQQQAAIHAQQVQAAQIAAIERAQAAQVAQTNVGPTALANAAQIDRGPEAQMRAAQLGLAGQYQDYIAGKEPSAAGIMLRQATDRNIASQYAMAAGATGMNTGLAQRTAMINAGELNGNVDAQQAILRAQEIAQARGALAGIYDSTRGADIGVATNQAGLQQQTNLANQGALNTSTLTQAQLNAARAQLQAQLTTGVSQFNAGQYNTRAIDQAQLQQGAAIANQGANLQASTVNATLAQQVALANAAAQNNTYATNASLQNAVNLNNSQVGSQVGIANANNQTSANSMSAQLANAINVANANNATSTSNQNAQLASQIASANASNQVTTNGQNATNRNNMISNSLTASGQAGTSAAAMAAAQAEMAKAAAMKDAAKISGGATVAAALLA